MQAELSCVVSGTWAGSKGLLSVHHTRQRLAIVEVTEPLQQRAWLVEVILGQGGLHLNS